MLSCWIGYIVFIFVSRMILWFHVDYLDFNWLGIQQNCHTLWLQNNMMYPDIFMYNLIASRRVGLELTGFFVHFPTQWSCLSNLILIDLICLKSQKTNCDDTERYPWLQYVWRVHCSFQIIAIWECRQTAFISVDTDGLFWSQAMLSAPSSPALHALPDKGNMLTVRVLIGLLFAWVCPDSDSILIWLWLLRLNGLPLWNGTPKVCVYKAL